MIRFSIIILLLSALQGQDKGTKAFENGKYDEARAYYEHILNNRKNDAAASFGLGATAYKQQDLEIATRSLNTVKNSDDPLLAAKALYNLGNMFRDQQKMDESLAMYRKAIELDPMDEDAKINYELLKQVIEQQKDKEQKQQDQDSEQKQDDDGQSQESQDKQQDNKEDQKQSHQNQENQKQSEKHEQQQQSQVEQEASEGKKSDKQMQAEAILNALKDQEKINQKRQIAKSKSRKMEKDW